MGQCTSSSSMHAVETQQHQQQHVGRTKPVKRGPGSLSSSLASKPSSTFGKMTKYLEENPPQPTSQKRRGSLLLRDSASAPVGEDMMLSSLNCSATFNMEMSNSSSLDFLATPPNSSHMRSRSPKRSITPPTATTSTTATAGSSSSKGDNGINDKKKSLVGNDNPHCWAALRDVTDRDYSTLDPLPEEIAIRSSTSSTNPVAEAESSFTNSNQNHKEEGEDDFREGHAGAKAEGEEEEEETNQGRRRSRRRSARDWKRSSMLYNKPSPNDGAPDPSQTGTGNGQQQRQGSTTEKKESSWQALSCASKHSNMSYESYASTNRSWMILASFDSGRNTMGAGSGSSHNKMDLARYEKEAMTNMHGICFTDSDNDGDDDNDDEDKEGEARVVDSVAEESKFWETNALRS